jgi:hypothetical protein
MMTELAKISEVRNALTSFFNERVRAAGEHIVIQKGHVEWFLIFAKRRDAT